MAETYSMISVVMYILAGILFLVSLIIFFKLKIYSVINNLSGRTARKAIEKMNIENRENANKNNNKIYYDIQKSEKISGKNNQIQELNFENSTELLDYDATELLPDITEIISNSLEATEILDNNQDKTEILQ